MYYDNIIQTLNVHKNKPLTEPNSTFFSTMYNKIRLTLYYTSEL